MSSKIKALLWKYKSIILYLIFGGLTTLVNIISYYICAHIFDIPTVASTWIAWLLSVLFAYITNRIWVFESQAKGFAAIFREMLAFFSCRLATGVLDVAFMYIFVDIIGWNDMIIKILSNVIVIILNYVASKILIFRKKEEKKDGNV